MVKVVTSISNQTHGNMGEIVWMVFISTTRAISVNKGIKLKQKSIRSTAYGEQLFKVDFRAVERAPNFHLLHVHTRIGAQYFWMEIKPSLELAS